MKIRTSLAGALLSLVVAAGCASSESSSGSGGEVERQQHSVVIGETVRVVLVSNRSTGFGWELNEGASSGMTHIAITRSGYTETDSPDGIVGAPGRQWWTISGVSTGKAEIHLDYKRSWETDTPPARRAVITMDVTQ